MLIVGITHKMSDKNLGASLHGIVERGVEGWTLNFGVNVSPHAEQKDQSLYVAIDNGKVEEVLTSRVDLHSRGKQ